MKPTLRIRALLATVPLLAAASIAPGCLAVAAGAGAGFLISRKVLPDEVHSAEVRMDSDRVWSSARETLEILVDVGSEVTVQESPRVLTAKVDGALVEVEIEAFDLERTRILVRAEKYLTSDAATADLVLNRILERLDAARAAAR